MIRSRVTGCGALLPCLPWRASHTQLGLVATGQCRALLAAVSCRQAPPSYRASGSERPIPSPLSGRPGWTATAGIPLLLSGADVALTCGSGESARTARHARNERTGLLPVLPFKIFGYSMTCIICSKTVQGFSICVLSKHDRLFTAVILPRQETSG
jgi:hypothetical protein